MSSIASLSDKAKCQTLLKECYKEATKKNGLIDFTKEIVTEEVDFSGKYSLSRSRLTNLFSNTVWKEFPTKSGHRKIQNLVTNIIIEYGNHSRDIDPGAALTIYHSVQEHLNILCNNIFLYKNRNWKEEPNYTASYKRLVEQKI